MSDRRGGCEFGCCRQSLSERCNAADCYRAAKDCLVGGYLRACCACRTVFVRTAAFQSGIEDICRIRFESSECSGSLPCAVCAPAIFRALNRVQPDACGAYLRRRGRGGSGLCNLRHCRRRAGNDATLRIACGYGDCDCSADIAFRKSISRAGGAGYVFAGAFPLIRGRSQSYFRR